MGRDASTSAPLRSLGAGAFTKELDAAVLEGRADVSVHSLKDCPSTLDEGLVLAACLPRADPRDVLILAEGETAKSLGELMPGSHVGTSSSRRAAQIKHSYPHLQVVSVRGNVDLRLNRIRAREMTATVMALAGLQRLGKEHLATQVLSTEEMLPAACQGAVGVVCREDDEYTQELLQRINHRPTLLEVTAERACLAALLGSEEAGRGGEAFPDFAWACHCRMSAEGSTMDLDCLVSSLDGKELFRYSEFERSVVDEQDAVSLGALYGGILRMVAGGQGWVQGGGWVEE